MIEQCSRCGGEMGVIGILGRRVHFMCRGCGGEESEMLVEQDELGHYIECLAEDSVSGFWDVDADALQP